MKLMSLGLIPLSMVLSSMVLSHSALAQDVTDQTAEPVDEVIATATVQSDPAMSAWHAGDFATAEIEFKKNAFCALRAEREFTSAVESARESSTRADLSEIANSAPLPIGGQGGAGGGPSTAAAGSVSAIEATNLRNKRSVTKRTCEDRGYQLYMMGMSQLKLGRMEDAKESLARAAAMRKNLYDAHFRLALIEYQDGNIDRSKKHFKKLRKLESKCKGCDAEAEIEAQISYLKGLLG